MKTRTALIVASLSLGAALSASAQGVYRIVGPDGRVSFSDQPPPANSGSRPQAVTPGAAGTGGGAQLPFELRQTATRYPVVLYTGKDCAPCNSGRNLLNARGIPYTEKTVTTAEDVEALKRLAGEASLPLLSIGSQRLRGYSDAEWTQYLNAAGYPAQSALPPGYRRAAPSPLVDVAPAAGNAAPSGAARGNDSTAPTAPAEVPVTPPPSNPAGIRF
ncbi:MAG: glutaredoxin family protein [Hydrogenophaga sp.]|uniref:glutaredoxin family protein n=1 Tax=Hydrogenophaga sp. TaxID=1904254 RepID=UPI00257D3D49|nr:glutaredoxin family protein [Hydrogenophaga sp.]MBL0945781.1 glutaredoxin family protein [Hydrogenophaga sp.]